MKIAVVGSGSWGTALSLLLARNGHDVTLAGRDEDEIAGLNLTRENMRYLPGFVMPETLRAVMLAKFAGQFDFIVLAVPTNSIRNALEHIHNLDAFKNTPILAASKGLEFPSGLVPTEVIKKVMPWAEVGAISGPNLAIEVAQGIPTAAVVAFEKQETADMIRSAFNCSTFRAYRTSDLIGIELSGALKNVLAIGAGMNDGLGFGNNTKGALIARGLREILTIGQAFGAKQETFLGIAGVGDLFATCNSHLSRNYRIGEALAKGTPIDQALKELGQVAEGVATCQAIASLLRSKQIEAPIFDGLALIVQGRLDPIQGVRQLMERVTPEERIPSRGEK